MTYSKQQGREHGCLLMLGDFLLATRMPGVQSLISRVCRIWSRLLLRLTLLLWVS